ncbi:hypothetical protein D3C85_1569090 [compost metagenome]
MSTSKNKLLISVAVSASTSPFVINTPPNAETGSHAKASTHACLIVGREATPQAFVCFKIANVGSVNSSIIATAASTSTKLL